MPIILESPAASGGGGSGTVTNVSSANTGIAVANPTTTPTLTLATLDVIAADGPPAANWSNNSKKITSIANGAGAQDAAAFGQIPTALPPNGAAGGDLTGTYPNPTFPATASAANQQTLVRAASAWVAGYGPTVGPYAPTTRVENIPRVVLANISAVTLVAQRTFLTGIYLSKGMVVNSITFVSGGTALAGGNHQLFGLYDDQAGHETGTARALLATSADDTSNAWSANTAKTLNLTYTVLNSGLFYVAILVDAATPPTIVANNQGGSSTASLAALSPIIANFNTGTTTSLANPATALNTGTTAVPWVAVTLAA